MIKFYAQINSGSLVIGVAQLKGDIEDANMIEVETYDPSLIGSIYNPVDGSFTPQEVTEVITKLTRIKFKQRMTSSERIAIRAYASSTEPYAPEVFDFMDLLSEATYIDLSLPETIEGVNLLETLGLLAAGRADEILNTPVTEEEAY